MNTIYFISRDANWQHYRNEILNYLSIEKGVYVEILTTGQLKPYLKDSGNLKYRVFTNIFSDKRKINFFPSALWYIWKNRPDCVIGQNGALNITEYFALIVCKILKIRYVWWTRAYEHKPVKNLLLRKMRQRYVNFFLRRADAIIVYSKIGYEFLVQIGYSRKRIYLAYNTLDTHKLKNIKDRTRQQLNKQKFIKLEFPEISYESKFILFSGRINRFKKVHNLVKAMKCLVGWDINIHLIVIGEGEEMGKCVDLATNLNLGRNIHFKGAIYDQDELGKYFEIADIYSIPGSVGLGIVHAFSFGLPIITEDLDYHSAEIQYLKNDVNGYFVPEDEPQKLAEAIFKVLNDRTLLRKLSENALRTSENEAGVDVMINEFYRALTGSEKEIRAKAR
ncbi:glycosyltransferase family 4 protein [Negadavirga shengliensis]|uniref:Glycosyltransferase family 4 protein n=1 Tax=Negadavirga shengliensis TaxID=1389218 RepID=A0ABV9T3R0_9BACT